MKAARLYKKNDIRIEEIEFKKDLKSDEVLVEICYAGICGSDLHNFETGAWISRSPSEFRYLSDETLESVILVKIPKTFELDS